jgi:hypothetical protein
VRRFRAGGARLLALLILPPATAAQWEITQETLPPDTEQTVVALVQNSQGARLRVFRDGAGTVMGLFTPRPGLLTVAKGCPTYVVDDQPPVALADPDVADSCVVDGGGARFLIGEPQRDEIRSSLLLALMNGSRVRVLYHVSGVGYREAAFTLRASKQAVHAVIGDGVIVVDQ